MDVAELGAKIFQLNRCCGALGKFLSINAKLGTLSGQLLSPQLLF
jgi:hypothetical protein